MTVRDFGPVVHALDGHGREIASRACIVTVDGIGSRFVLPFYVEAVDESLRILTGREMLQLKFSEGSDVFREWLQQEEMYTPSVHQPYRWEISAREVSLNIRPELIPLAVERFGIDYRWTSKSHPLRIAATRELIEYVSPLLDVPFPVRYDRVYRELRSLLRNGVTALNPADGPFGEILVKLRVAVVATGNQKTDVLYITPSGRKKARFVMPVELPEGHPAQHLLQDAEHTVDDLRWIRRIVRGTINPVGMKLVSTLALKGMTLPVRQYYDAEGNEVDLVVELNSVQSKDLQCMLLDGAADDGVWFVDMLFGCTHAAELVTGPHNLKVRPEIHAIADLRLDPLEMIQKDLAWAEELRLMARDLGLALI